MVMTVPEQRNTIAQVDSSGVDVTAIGRPVRGATWIDAARLQNWLAGRGSMDVPAHAPMAWLDDEVGEFRYWTKPRFQTARYAYHVSLNIPGNKPAIVTIDGVSTEVQPATRANPRPVTLYRDRASLSDAETELVITIEPGEGNQVHVESIAIEAVPRTQLLVTNDLGVDRLGFLARQPIAAPALTADLLGAQAALRQSCRRVGLFQFSRGTHAPWTSTSTTPVNLFADSFSLTGRKLYASDTRPGGRTKWAALARCSNGTTSGRIAMVGGSTNFIDVPTGTTGWTWFFGAFAHDVEDNTTASGYRGGAPDEYNVTLARTAGTGTISVASLSFYDVGA